MLNEPISEHAYRKTTGAGGIVVPAGWVKEKTLLLSGAGTFTSEPIPANAHGPKFSLPFETETENDNPFW